MESSFEILASLRDLHYCFFASIHATFAGTHYLDQVLHLWPELRLRCGVPVREAGGGEQAISELRLCARRSAPLQQCHLSFKLLVHGIRAVSSDASVAHLRDFGGQPCPRSHHGMIRCLPEVTLRRSLVHMSRSLERMYYRERTQNHGLHVTNC